ncbi:MAG: DUF1987 domain-containing protein [Bacteroidales bacterium]|nr:DUF1987 domain-containing protein [Bacteroidales bacterium]
MNSLKTLNEDYYIIDGDKEVPTVILDKKHNKFEFSGISIPEDALSFYLPIIEWLDLYKFAPNEKTSVSFKMVYINSASSKMLDRVFQKLEEIHSSGNQVEIQWYYHIDDEDMLTDGKIYLDKKSMPFELINYGNNN